MICGALVPQNNVYAMMQRYGDSYEGLLSASLYRRQQLHLPKGSSKLIVKERAALFWKLGDNRQWGYKEGREKFLLTESVSGELYNKFKSICDRLGLDTRKKIYVRGKWDNKTPHTESKLKKVILDYSGCHGWIMTMHPSSRPPTNTCNLVFFAALAK